MPADIVHHTGSWITEHPYASAGIAVGTLVIVWYLMSGSSAPAAATSTASDTGAASIVAAQIAANASTANTAAAAQVTNNQTAASQAVSLAQIQATHDTAVAQATASTKIAQYNDSASIAASNNSVTTAYINASAAEQLSNNNTLASEFSALAGVLNSYFGKASSGTGVFANVSNVATNQYNNNVSGQISQSIANATGTGGATTSVSSTSSYKAQNAGAYSWTTPVGNPNLTTTTASLLSGFSSLLAGLGVGLQKPVTSTLSAANLQSLSALNFSAVNGWSNHT